MASLIQPNQLNNSTQFHPKDTVGDLLTEIVRGNVVLVLGHEGILKDSDDFCKGDVKDYMYKSFMQYMKAKNRNFQVSYADFNDYYYNLRPDLAELKDEIVNFIDPENGFFDFKDEHDYSPLLFELLKRKYFKLVLTTTYDYYVEAMLTKVWGRRPRVISIYDVRNDIEKSDSGQLDIEPTLYYVFGRGEANKDFALIENDAMKVTEKWFCDKPTELLNYLSKKTILALGTKYDDWLFRFFWFMLHRDVRILRRGRVAISLNPDASEIDKKLCQYLDNEKIKHLSMPQAIRKILDGYDDAEKRFIAEHGRRGQDIFISYHSTDFDSVKHFFCSLEDYFKDEKMNVHIWFDNNPDLQQGINPSDDYKSKICTAINRCKVFIPVITSSVKDILEEEEVYDKDVLGHFFLDHEWQQALSRKSLNDSRSPIKIMPICLEGIDIKYVHPNTAHANIFSLVEDVSSGSNRTQLEYRKFLAMLKELLKS